MVVLSLRNSESWWESADETAFSVLREAPPPEPPFMPAWHSMVVEMYTKMFPGMLEDKEAAIAAFERHNAEVRETIPSERLLEWRPQERGPTAL